MTSKYKPQAHTPGPLDVLALLMEAAISGMKATYCPCALDACAKCRANAKLRRAVAEGGKLSEYNDERRRLIAAAPDLLAALKASEYALNAYCSTHSRASHAGCCDALKEARAAIAKAQGQEGK